LLHTSSPPGFLLIPSTYQVETSLCHGFHL
jgi:hypothetical protein